MPARIYALAKELKLDSGELSDICTKAGIAGKNSALASLTDAEVKTLKEYISGGGRQASKPSKPTAPKAVKAPVPRGSASKSFQNKVVDTGALRREDYVAPSGSVGGTPRVLDVAAGKRAVNVKSTAETPDSANSNSGNSSTAKPSPKPPPKVGPTIKLAPLPPSKQPPAGAPVDTGPAPQAPDLKLPTDAIRAGKAGDSKPLSEHLRRHGKKKPEKTPAGKSAGPAAVPGSGVSPLRDRGRRKEKPAAGPGKTLLGGREARQLNRKRQARRRGGEEDTRRRRPHFRRRSGTNTAAPRKGKVTLEIPCTVRSFSEAIGVPANVIQRQLLSMMDKMCTINSELDIDTVEMLAVELGADVELRHAATLEDTLLTEMVEREDDAADLQRRPPIVTFLGHVDHGKTSLLDAIIGIDVVSGERGGITQHIRAYDVEKDGRKISFVDTPGHEAFTEMRARGANVTDVAVLVVAADDGVMPQTEEAISHARAAGVPIVIALNKIDLPGVDENRILQQLAANELLTHEWGGDVELIRTSATKGTGIDDLLEMLLFIAEDKEYQANPTRAAYGTCLEAHLHEGRGVVSTFVVQNGTLRVGDCIVCGTAYGRVKAMYNTLDPRKSMTEAGPSTPVNITGLGVAPSAGDRFYVLDDIAQCREIAEQRDHQTRSTSLAPPAHVTLEGLFDRLGQEETQTLNLILRADVHGSIEAIQQELGKIQHPEVKFRILQATVGGISEADVHLADASDAIICGFNVVPDELARSLAQDRGVQIRRYDIIYNLTDDLRAALEGMLKPEKREAELGRALVQRTFKISRVGTVAGCRVLSGVIQRNARARVIRDSTVIGDYPIEALRREKDDAKEVREGLECGIKLSGYNDMKEADILEAYKIEEVARTLDKA